MAVHRSYITVRPLHMPGCLNCYIYNAMIYLASQSPRRRSLLKQAGIAFTIIPGAVNEIPMTHESAKEYVNRMSREKAINGWESVKTKNLPYYPLLAADTIVTLHGSIMGKPGNEEQARKMLKTLSGQDHQVMTAITITNGTQTRSIQVTSLVKMAALTENEISAYLQTQESFDKAGAYAIQGKGALLIESIEGSYSNIVGLPLRETAQLLSAFS
ncbi:Maf-like protein YhdE [invertebrate metagenome]|uniref:Maf-like protein YhdE n=1 Tax=invertebrate metagenome TaxID=1711999 RepID=A0A2H9T9P6_9ZZZZ